MPFSASVTRLFSQKRPWIFDLMFWTPFWAIPDLSLPPEPILIMGKNVVMGVTISVLLAVLANLISGKWRRYFYLVVGLFLWFGAAIFIAYTVVGHTVVNALSLFDVGQYTFVGVRPFTWISGEQALPFWLAALSLPFVILVWQWRRLGAPANRVYVALLSGLLLLPIPFEIANCAVTDACNVGRLLPRLSILDHYAPGASFIGLAQLVALRADLAFTAEIPLPAISANKSPLTLVVVVGESTSRSHMSLYGYCRPTTPNLDALAAQSYVFHDVISPIPLTTLAVPAAITVETKAAAGQPVSDFPLPKILNKGGFTTYWISNQWTNFSPSDHISRTADTASHVLWLNGEENISQSTDDPLDSDLVAPFTNALRDPQPKKAIFLHMIGGHITYTSRFPKGYMPGGLQPAITNRDRDAIAQIDDYDRALHYDDSLLGKMMGELQKSGGDAAFVFFSDHGEEVYDQIDWHGHTYPGTRRMVEIPLMVWLSPSLRAHRPDLVQALSRVTEQRLQVKDMAALLTEIAGVQVAGLEDVHLPLSPLFNTGPRLGANQNYDLDRNLGTKTAFPPLCDKRTATGRPAG